MKFPRFTFVVGLCLCSLGIAPASMAQKLGGTFPTPPKLAKSPAELEIAAKLSELGLVGPIVKVRLSIDKEGKVTGCTYFEDHGGPEVRGEACKLLAAEYLFMPATAYGEATSGTYTVEISLAPSPS